MQSLLKISVGTPMIALSNTEKYNEFSSNIFEIDKLSKKLDEAGNTLINERQKLNDSELLKANLEEKVQERTAELTKELQIKTEFLNNVSHEIRTPVQGVTAISKGLVDHWSDFDDTKKYKFIKDIFKSSDKLFFLINNLLDVSKFSSGKMKFHFEMVDIKKIIRIVEDEFKLYLTDNNLKILHQIDPVVITKCYADSNRICQVIRNLLSNAIKFTNGGVIKIKVENTSIFNDQDNKSIDYIKVSVKDNGVGIPESEIDQIFESFSQSSRTKTVTIGSGLGLSICREIIKGHSGQIWAENNKGEQGATILFTIPSLEKQQQDEIIVDRTKIINILLIDDEDVSHTSLSLLLYGKNFNIHACNSGHTALDYLNKHNREVDLIMLDLIMPDIHGLEILKTIKQDKNLSHIPVLIQSGMAGNSEVADAVKFGAIDHIEKPFNKRLLLDKINLVLSKKNGN